MTRPADKASRPLTRRAILTAAGALGISGVARAAVPTPGQVEGPFYPDRAKLAASDADLTNRGPKGEIIDLVGRIFDSQGKPVSGARLELWQADAAGRYRHKRDGMRNDPDFDGFGQVISNGDGGFAFRTLMPGAYAISATDWRTPHIHFKLWQGASHVLTTQLYFPDHPLNARDMFLPNLPVDQRAQATAQEQEGASPFGEGASRQFSYDIHLS